MRTKDIIIIVVTFILALILTYCDSSNKMKLQNDKTYLSEKEVEEVFEPPTVE